MVPHARNPLFTGRQAVLTAIHEGLQQPRAAGITQAITGLGGVGKSQTALEYAYRHREEYSFVLWMGAESEETLNRDYGETARRLDLPATDATEPEVVREGVRAWLAERSDYLLILDNADKPHIAKPYLPAAPRGHVLVTSRAHSLTALRVAQPIALAVLPEDEAIAFLLARAGRPNDAKERPAAGELARELGYLPLALEQAAAYIAMQGIGFGDYVTLYRRLRLGLLERAKPEWGDTERTVLTTWRASFEAVRAANPAAADLLTLSAFFAPDQIPYELLILGAPELGKRLAAALAGAQEDSSRLWELLTVPANYSLIQRDAETQSYSVHRLVQEVIRAPRAKQARGAGLTTAQHRRWAERAVRALNRAFPLIGLETWPRCERLLPHAMACATWIRKEGLEFAEAGRLLSQTGYYLRERGQYAAAEPFFERALAIREQVLGPAHPDTAVSCGNLAGVYRDQGKLAEVEQLLLHALVVHEQSLGPMHPSTATSCNNLAALYHEQGKLAEAEPLYLRALMIRQQVLGSDHPDTANSLNNVAELRRLQGRLPEAKTLLKQALTIYERARGPNHPDTGNTLNNLGGLYRAQGKLKEAEPYLQRALGVSERVRGPEHPETGTCLNNLGGLYRDQERLADAEPLLERGLRVREDALGPDHPDTAISLQDLAQLYQIQGRVAQAEGLTQRALAIRERALGRDHPYTAASCAALAGLYHAEGKLKEAETLYLRALETWDHRLGAWRIDMAASLNNLAMLYRAQGRLTDAEPLVRRALPVFEEALGSEHPKTRLCRQNHIDLQAEMERQ